MKFLRRTKREINENFLENLLIDRGILEDNEDYKNRYFNPTAKELLPPELLDNMKEGKELLEKHIKNNKISTNQLSLALQLKAHSSKLLQ